MGTRRLKMGFGDHAPCRMLGPCGLPFFSDHRHTAMMVGTAFILLGTIFQIIGCVGLSAEAGAIKSCHWARYDIDGSTVYMNLEAFRVDVSNTTHTTTQVIKWDDIDKYVEPSSKLKECKTHSHGMQVAQVLGTFLGLTTVGLTKKRGDAGTDNAGQKFISVVIVILTQLPTFYNLHAFANHCAANAPSSEDAKYGP